MKITREEVLHVAQLARLKLPEETTERLTGQIERHPDLHGQAG